jgi:hypothetical protein
MESPTERWLTRRAYPSEEPVPLQQQALPSRVESDQPTPEDDEDYLAHQNAVLQYYILDDGQAEPSVPTYTNYHFNAGSPVNEVPDYLAPEEGSQQQFDEEVMIYYRCAIETSSQFTDPQTRGEDWPCANWIAEDYTYSPASSSTTLLTPPPEEDSTPWGCDPEFYSLPHLDMTKFEVVSDFDGGKKVAPWPWNDYQYRPPTPETYLDPEDYLMEAEMKEIEEVMREEIMEMMAQEAIDDGKRETRRQKKRERKERKERKKRRRRTDHEADQPAGTVAFDNQVVHGRTIYNP